MILLASVGLGLLLGWLLGGTLENLSRLHIRGGWLAIAAALSQSLLRGPMGDRIPIPAAARVTLWLLSVAILTAFVLRNRSLLGMRVIAAGLVLNAVVIALNGGMPVSAHAVRVASPDAAGVAVWSSFYHYATSSTRLLVLGDVVPLPLGSPFATVLSLGDLLLAVGVLVVIVEGMRRDAAG